MKDLLHEIWSTLRQNKLRTALTGFAVAWGIFMLIALLGAGNGVLNALMGNAGGMENSMVVYSGWTSKAYNGFARWRRIRLDSRDVDILGTEAFDDHVDDVCPVVEQEATLVYGDRYLSCTVKGLMPVYQQIQKEQVVAGRFINALDIRDQRKVLLIGSTEAAQLLRKGEPVGSLVGKDVKVGPFSYRVVGIYKSDESMGSYVEVFAPFSTISTIYRKGTEIPEIYLSFHGLKTEADNEAFEKQYTRTVNLHHSAAPDDDNTVYIWNRFTMNKQMNRAVRIVRIALWILGLFTLLSGIVGVSNIMLITVKERTHEFGIRKAIGARPGSILTLIITESIAITAFFGYLGMLLGLIANYVMDATLADNPIDFGVGTITMFVDPTVGIDVAVEATLVLIVAGTLAGLIPAWKAAKVKPIEALRAD